MSGGGMGGGYGAGKPGSGYGGGYDSRIGLPKPFYGDRSGGMNNAGIRSSRDLNLNTGLPSMMGTAQTGFMPTGEFMAQYGGAPPSSAQPQAPGMNPEFSPVGGSGFGNIPGNFRGAFLPQMSNAMQPPNPLNFRFPNAFEQFRNQVRNRFQNMTQPNSGSAPPQAMQAANSTSETGPQGEALNGGGQQAYDNALSQYNSPEYAAYFNSLAPSTRAYMHAPGNQAMGNYLAGQARDSYNAFGRNPWGQ